MYIYIHPPSNPNTPLSYPPVPAGLMAKIKPTPWREALMEAGFPNVNEDDLTPLFQYLEFCLKQVHIHLFTYMGIDRYVC